MDLHLTLASSAEAPVPASYGRACANCVKAKSKCLARSGSQVCERCLRLGRECIIPEPARRRNKKTSTLEEKVDGILSLLQSGPVVDKSKVIDVTSSTSQPIDTPISSSSVISHKTTPQKLDERSDSESSSKLKPEAWEQVRALHTESCVVTPASSNPGPPAGDVFNLSYSMLGLSEEESESFLAEFRTKALPQFAFMHIPTATTALRLHQEHPFLFICIIAVSSKSNSRRQAMGREVKQMIARGMTVENEQNLDLLLGLLVFITWGHDQFVNNPLMSRFAVLAISMVFELRLNKPPFKGPPTIFNIGPHGEDRGEVACRTVEEQRAVLGCWLLSSIISWYFVKIDALHWTPHMDECLKALSLKQECSTDEMFCCQVRLQLIAAKAIQLSSNQTTSISDGVKVPVMFHIKALRAELLAVNAIMCHGVVQNQILLASMHHTELCINSLALLSDEPLISTTSEFSRLDYLSACVPSIKSWFQTFFAIPPTSYLSLAFPVFTQLTHSIVILYKLSVLDDPAWDRGLVRETVDIFLILEQLIGNFQLMAGTTDSTEEPAAHVFAKLAYVFDSVRTWLKNKPIPSRVHENSASSANSHTNNGDGAGEVALQDGELMDMMDDAWMSEVLGPWSYDFMQR